MQKKIIKIHDNIARNSTDSKVVLTGAFKRDFEIIKSTIGSYPRQVKQAVLNSGDEILIAYCLDFFKEDRVANLDFIYKVVMSERDDVVNEIAISSFIETVSQVMDDPSLFNESNDHNLLSDRDKMDGILYYLDILYNQDPLGDSGYIDESEERTLNECLSFYLDKVGLMSVNDQIMNLLFESGSLNRNQTSGVLMFLEANLNPAMLNDLENLLYVTEGLEEDVLDLMARIDTSEAVDRLVVNLNYLIMIKEDSEKDFFISRMKLSLYPLIKEENVLPLLDSDDFYTKIRALDILASQGSMKSLSKVKALMTDSEPQIRSLAAKVFREIISGQNRRQRH